LIYQLYLYQIDEHVLENLNHILFYTIEKSIKSYRQFAQRQIAAAGFDITIDQWLVLKTIEEDSTATQQQMAAKVFKDMASMTRIVELLVRKNYLLRKFNTSDRRRFDLELTATGKNLLQQIQPLIVSNRSTALKGISDENLQILQSELEKITSNVQ